MASNNDNNNNNEPYYSNYGGSDTREYDSPTDPSEKLVSWRYILRPLYTSGRSIECYNCCVGGKLNTVNDTHVCGFIEAAYPSYLFADCLPYMKWGPFGVVVDIKNEIDPFGQRRIGNNTQDLIIPNCHATFSNIGIAHPIHSSAPVSTLYSSSAHHVFTLLSLIVLALILICKN